MAAVVTNTRTADITLTDNQGYDTTYKINNPASSITRAAIEAVYAPVFAGGYLASKQGYAFTQVSRVIINEVTSRKEALD